MGYAGSQYALCQSGCRPLVQTVPEAFQSENLILVYLFYVSLICYSPYFYSMYTDIPPLPLIALQLWWALDLLEGKPSGVSWKKMFALGVFIWRDYVDPSDDYYCRDGLLDGPLL